MVHERSTLTGFLLPLGLVDGRGMVNGCLVSVTPFCGPRFRFSSPALRRLFDSRLYWFSFSRFASLYLRKYSRFFSRCSAVSLTGCTLVRCFTLWSGSLARFIDCFSM